jgi:phage RecT family recombinase
MQTRTNGNGQQQRGQQGRPDIKAKERRGPERVREILEERRTEIEAMFARDPDPKASFTRAVGLAVDTYKQVQGNSDRIIDESSAAQSALWAFQRKLDPGTEVYFVPFAGKVTPIVSPQGLINLAFRSGLVLACQARWVFRKEVEEGNFDHQLGSDEWVRHKKGTNARPKTKKESWDQLEFSYAVIKLKGGEQIIEVHDRADIEYYRSLSKSQDRGLWADWPAEAARKAVLKQALGRAPKQSEVSEILAADAANESALDLGKEFWDGVEKRVEEAGGQMPPDDAPAPPVQYQAGDPAKMTLPGADKAVRVSDADGAKLAHWEGVLRTDLDAGSFDPGGKKADHAQWYISLLLTIRERMREVGLAYPTHPRLGTGFSPSNRGGDGALSEEDEQAAFAAPTGGYAEG